MEGDSADDLQQSHDDGPFHGSLPADHPMLQQAQEKLKQQLLAIKQRLEEELQERKYAIKAAQEERLNLGVELYGFQQQLAQIQKIRQESESKAAQLAAEREEEEPALVGLRQQAAQNAQKLDAQKAEVEAFRSVLNNTSNELRLLQQHVEEKKGAVLVQKGVSEATERSAKNAAAAQEEQARIRAKLENQIAAEHAKHAALLDQHAQQTEKAKAANTTLNEVDKDIERVQAENRKRSQQWQANLQKLQKLEAKLKETELKTEELRQQHRDVQAELKACRRESRAAAHKADEVSLELERVQGENEVALQATQDLTKQDEALKDRFTFQATMKQFEESLATTESALKEAQAEGKALARQVLEVEKGMHAATEDIQAAKRERLQQLSNQAAMDSAARDTAKQTVEVKAKVAKLQREIEAVQRGTAATKAEIARVEASNASQAAALMEQEAQLKDKEKKVEAGQAGLEKQMQELARKGRELDALNRKYEKAVADVPQGEDAGPLEATIHNLRREVNLEAERLEEHKAAWLSQQTELHALSVSNAKAAEDLALLQSTQAVMEHQHARLERQRATVMKDIKDVDRNIAGQRNTIARLNSQLADTKATKAAVDVTIVGLQGQLEETAKDGECEVERLIKEADDLKAEKQRILSEVIQTQHQIKETEKAVQLTKEMQLALHPEHGRAEVKALESDVRRAELRLSDLHATQHRLQNDLSNVIAKRETYIVKGRAMERLAEDRKGPSSMEHKKKQMVAALETNLKESEKKIEEARAEAEALEAQHAELQLQGEAVEEQCKTLKHAQEQDEADMVKLNEQRCQVLIFTARAQRNIKLYKEAGIGKLKISNNLERQLKRARSKHGQLWMILQGIAEANPECSQEIQRALMHHMYATASDENVSSNMQVTDAAAERQNEATDDGAVST